jgi:murein tripeptide amidase MpaA
MQVLLFAFLFQLFQISELPKTRAEISNFTETSTYSDVITFIDGLSKQSEIINSTVFGKSFEGRDLPLVILSKPKIASPREAHSSGKLIVLLLGNIHAGEVEGKEAILHTIRKFHSDEKFKKLLNDLIILAIPILNADGNEKISPTNRLIKMDPSVASVSEKILKGLI